MGGSFIARREADRKPSRQGWKKEAGPVKSQIEDPVNRIGLIDSGMLL